MFSGCMRPFAWDRRRISTEIDHDLERERRASKEQDIIKLLLLGTSESGKSTLIKQMKIIHIRSFTEKERKSKISEVRQTLHECIYDIASFIQKNNFLCDQLDESTRESIFYILQWGELGPSEFPNEYFHQVFRIWKHPLIQKNCATFQHSEIIDCTKYFLSRLDTIRQTDYTPNEQDILRCHKPTVDVQKLTFRMKISRAYGKHHQEFWMYDVGGQRAERRKWIHVFSGIHAIIFMVACSEFDQTLRENTDVNRLQESLTLFSELWTSRFLLSSGFILFLNKQDILKEKIENGNKLEKYFPEYRLYKEQTHSFTEYDKVKLFIKDKFLEISKIKRDIKIHNDLSHRLSCFHIVQQLFYHFTTITDTNQTKKIFENVHRTILLEMISSVQLN